MWRSLVLIIGGLSCVAGCREEDIEQLKRCLIPIRPLVSQPDLPSDKACRTINIFIKCVEKKKHLCQKYVTGTQVLDIARNLKLKYCIPARTTTTSTPAPTTTPPPTVHDVFSLCRDRFRGQRHKTLGEACRAAESFLECGQSVVSYEDFSLETYQLHAELLRNRAVYWKYCARTALLRGGVGRRKCPYDVTAKLTSCINITYWQPVAAGDVKTFCRTVPQFLPCLTDLANGCHHVPALQDMAHFLWSSFHLLSYQCSQLGPVYSDLDYTEYDYYDQLEEVLPPAPPLSTKPAARLHKSPVKSAPTTQTNIQPTTMTSKLQQTVQPKAAHVGTANGVEPEPQKTSDTANEVIEPEPQKTSDTANEVIEPEPQKTSPTANEVIEPEPQKTSDTANEVEPKPQKTSDTANEVIEPEPQKTSDTASHHQVTQAGNLKVTSGGRKSNNRVLSEEDGIVPKGKQTKEERFNKIPPGSKKLPDQNTSTFKADSSGCREDTKTAPSGKGISPTEERKQEQTPHPCRSNTKTDQSSRQSKTKSRRKQNKQNVDGAGKGRTNGTKEQLLKSSPKGNSRTTSDHKPPTNSISSPKTSATFQENLPLTTPKAISTTPTPSRQQKSILLQAMTTSTPATAAAMAQGPKKVLTTTQPTLRAVPTHNEKTSSRDSSEDEAGKFPRAKSEINSEKEIVKNKTLEDSMVTVNSKSLLTSPSLPPKKEPISAKNSEAKNHGEALENNVASESSPRPSTVYVEVLDTTSTISSDDSSNIPAEVNTSISQHYPSNNNSQSALPEPSARREHSQNTNSDTVADDGQNPPAPTSSLSKPSEPANDTSGVSSSSDDLHPFENNTVDSPDNPQSDITKSQSDITKSQSPFSRDSSQNNHLSSSTDQASLTSTDSDSELSSSELKDQQGRKSEADMAEPDPKHNVDTQRLRSKQNKPSVHQASSEDTDSEAGHVVSIKNHTNTDSEAGHVSIKNHTNTDSEAGHVVSIKNHTNTEASYRNTSVDSDSEIADLQNSGSGQETRRENSPSKNSSREAESPIASNGTVGTDISENQSIQPERGNRKSENASKTFFIDTNKANQPNPEKKKNQGSLDLEEDADRKEGSYTEAEGNAETGPDAETSTPSEARSPLQQGGKDGNLAVKIVTYNNTEKDPLWDNRCPGPWERLDRCTSIMLHARLGSPDEECRSLMMYVVCLAELINTCPEFPPFNTISDTVDYVSSVLDYKCPDYRSDVTHQDDIV